MSDLRKALEEAGLLDKQTSRRLQHEERVQKKTIGRQGTEAEKEQKAAEREQSEMQKKADVRLAQEKHNRDAREQGSWKSVLKRLHQEAIREGGPRRFHYRERSGLLPSLAVDEQCARRLEAGELAIVELPGDHVRVVIVPIRLGEDVRALRAELVLHPARA